MPARFERSASDAEHPTRIEPTTLDPMPSEAGDAIADLAAESARLASALHPRTAASLAHLVRVMNAYYSNLIEGHDTRPREIERALAGDLDVDETRRNLQEEAAAHVRVQAEVDRLAADGRLPEPASPAFVRWLHRTFYEHGPEAMLDVSGRGDRYRMEPGAWRRSSDQDVAVGRHLPPSGRAVDSFMNYFAERFRFEGTRNASRMIAMAIAHHRFNYIHPFPDGNGRVSRLLSHAMAHRAGIGAHGLWSISRGLARGLEAPSDYKTMMDATDAPRENDLDGRGNLSRRALAEFVIWFLGVSLDQVRFMREQFELDRLMQRLPTLVERDDRLKSETAALLVEALLRGEFERGEAARLTGLPERSARRVLGDAVEAGLLASDTPKGAVSLRFPPAVGEILFPRLFP